ncbi:MAG TPA: MFS transporter [Candidatus Krumholzibacteriaceae bacterium]|jgi:MFS family permease|nr:MFS transporter [Candidatus Krumholzibacteriaceae bacterium]
MRQFLGFMFHEMAFGLLSIFLPLYVVNDLHLPGSEGLIYVGIMIAVANFAAVPFSFFWGYLCDRTRRYRLFILISFAGMSLLFYVFSVTSSIWLLIVLYGLISVFHVAHEAPKNVLIAEYYSREEWEHSFASYEGLTEVGWLAGLVLGFALSGVGLANVWFILFVSLLNAVAFVASLLLIRDPLFIFERRLVAIERVFNFAHRGFAVASRAFEGAKVNESLKEESVTLFCLGLLLFSFATSMLFTPLPVFFSRSLGLTQSVVFVVFIFNTIGTTTGYFLVGSRAEIMDEHGIVRRANLVRALLSISLILVAVSASVLILPFAILILVAMGLVYGFFLISSLSLSMELIPEGKAGVFYALVGLGGAFGCFLGTFIAESYGFPILFVVVGVVFVLGYIAFKAYA